MGKTGTMSLLMRRLKWLMGILLMLALMRWPEDMLCGIQRAASVWYYSVAPALFPFMALMPLLTCRESIETWEAMLGRFMEKLFHLPGGAAPAMIIAMLAGTPAGALAAERIAGESGMNRGQLQRLVVSVCGLSPAFITAGIGSAMLGSPDEGLLLLGCQIFSQLLMLLLLRNAWKNCTGPVLPPPESTPEQPVRGAVLSVLTVCGYMSVFGGIAEMIRRLLGNRAGDVLLCLLDLPSGAALVSSLYIERKARLLLLAAMIGFGGGCIGMQNLAVLKRNGTKPGVFFALKGLSAALSTGFMALQLRLNLEIHVANLPRTYVLALLCAIIIAIPAYSGIKKSVS